MCKRILDAGLRMQTDGRGSCTAEGNCFSSCSRMLISWAAASEGGSFAAAAVVSL